MKHASRLVRPGGRLVYCTCSFIPSENQERVAAFLRENDDFELEKVNFLGEEVEQV